MCNSSPGWSEQASPPRVCLHVPGLAGHQPVGGLYAMNTLVCCTRAEALSSLSEEVVLVSFQVIDLQYQLPAFLLL